MPSSSLPAVILNQGQFNEGRVPMLQFSLRNLLVAVAAVAVRTTALFTANAWWVSLSEEEVNEALYGLPVK